MKRGWFLLLALSLGLNAGLLYTVLSGSGWGRREFIPGPFIRDAEAPFPPGTSPHRPGQCPRDCEHLVHHRLGRMAEYLDLDEGLRRQMAGILEEMLPRILAERDAVQEARLAMRAEYRKPDADPARVRTLVQRMGNAQMRLDSLTAETMLLEAGLLSPQQRARYFESMPWGHRIGRGTSPRNRRRAPQEN